MVLNKIPNWCAACKISYLHNASRPTIEQILKLWKEKDLTASIILVSCGAKEQSYEITLNLSALRNGLTC